MGRCTEARGVKGQRHKMALRTGCGLLGWSYRPRLPGVSPGGWCSFIGGKIAQTERVYDFKDYGEIQFVGHPKEGSENFGIDLKSRVRSRHVTAVRGLLATGKFI